MSPETATSAVAWDCPCIGSPPATKTLATAERMSSGLPYDFRLRSSIQTSALVRYFILITKYPWSEDRTQDEFCSPGQSLCRSNYQRYDPSKITKSEDQLSAPAV